MSDSVRQLTASGSALFLEYLERLPNEPTLQPPVGLLTDDRNSEALEFRRPWSGRGEEGPLSEPVRVGTFPSSLRFQA